MKKTLLLAAIAAAAVMAGCHTAHIEVRGDGAWSADLYDNFIGRKIESCTADVQEGGKFKFNLNGYGSDVSEQLPVFTKEMWHGLGILGRLAGAAVNPAVAGVPLSDEAANADDVAKLIRENAAAKAKAEIKAAKAASGKSADCADGTCGIE